MTAKQLLETRLNFYTLAIVREERRIACGEFSRRKTLRWLTTTAKDIWLQIRMHESAQDQSIVSLAKTK